MCLRVNIPGNYRQLFSKIMIDNRFVVLRWKILIVLIHFFADHPKSIFVRNEILWLSQKLCDFGVSLQFSWRLKLLSTTLNFFHNFSFSTFENREGARCTYHLRRYIWEWIPKIERNIFINSALQTQDFFFKKLNYPLCIHTKYIFGFLIIYKYVIR